MKSLDVRGLSCPIPVLEVKKELELGIDTLKVFADCGTAKENITRFATNENYKVDVKDLGDGSVEFTISK